MFIKYKCYKRLALAFGMVQTYLTDSIHSIQDYPSCNLVSVELPMGLKGTLIAIMHRNARSHSLYQKIIDNSALHLLSYFEHAILRIFVFVMLVINTGTDTVGYSFVLLFAFQSACG